TLGLIAPISVPRVIAGASVASLRRRFRSVIMLYSRRRNTQSGSFRRTKELYSNQHELQNWHSDGRWIASRHRVEFSADSEDASAWDHPFLIRSKVRHCIPRIAPCATAGTGRARGQPRKVHRSDADKVERADY